MIRSDARWAHAARVALAATAIVAVVAFLLALVVNAIISDRLNRDIDNRLQAVLVTTSTSAPGTPVVGGGQTGGDLDDAPVFLWRVAADRSIAALTVGAPTLPTDEWTAGTSTQATEGSAFRFAAVPSAGGWLVAGESVAKVTEANGDILLVELVLGALLLVVTFSGSFIVGLRASAPIELVRRRQAEFTADASHELRTPLSVIEAEVDLALGRTRDAVEYEDVLRRIASESARLRAIVEDLLWLARADAPDTDRPPQEVVDLAPVVESTVSRFAAIADAGSLTLSAHTPGTGSARVRADTDGIDRLVAVLVDNACKYAGPGGAVDVTVAAVPGRVVLTVDDSGPGIPEDHRELVFDRFHRADPSPRGTGLGLAIADAVVRASSGTWSIGTSPLGGARFEVSWRPAARVVDDRPRANAPTSPIGSVVAPASPIGAVPKDD